jgi:hypothetical protein
MNDPASPNPPDLDGLQQWLQRAVTTPWQINAAEAPGIIASKGGELSPAERLQIYSGSYQGRLLECMRSEFPALELALDGDLFTRFASEYLIAQPPRSYTLTVLGAGFPGYLNDTRPDGDELWPEFIIELATLERIFSEVYHGEGVEKTGATASNETEAILLEPGSRRIECRFPIDRYFLAARDHLREPAENETPKFPAPEPTTLLIFRRDYVVKFRRLVEGQATSLS